MPLSRSPQLMLQACWMNGSEPMRTSTDYGFFTVDVPNFWGQPETI